MPDARQIVAAAADRPDVGIGSPNIENEGLRDRRASERRERQRSAVRPAALDLERMRAGRRAAADGIERVLLGQPRVSR